LGAKEQGAHVTEGRWLATVRTLTFVLRDGHVLLMKRAPTKRIFPNRYNGLGGHIERDEDPFTSALREVKEESGLDVHDLRLRGVYNIDSGESTGIVLFIFTAQASSAALDHECDEGTLHWVLVDQVQALDLVEDLPLILPRVLAMRPNDPPFFAHVSYDDSDRLVLRFADESTAAAGG
jgi:8-oxo-dGTP diphosphatase